MPTYEYACTACEHRFDAVQSFTDAALTECPECSGRLRKLYSSVGVVFKGPGFYRTDSRNGSGPKDSVAKDSGAKKESADKPASSGSKDSGTSSSSSSSGTTTPTAKAS